MDAFDEAITGYASACWHHDTADMGRYYTELRKLYQAQAAERQDKFIWMQCALDLALAGTAVINELVSILKEAAAKGQLNNVDLQKALNTLAAANEIEKRVRAIIHDS